MAEETAKVDIDEEEIERDQYLVFIIKAQEFGIQAMRVQEITAMMDVAEVPNAPAHIQGILNLRGRLVSAINFRKRFGFEAKEADEDTRIIIMDHGGFPVGIIVDSVEEVIKVASQKVQQLPPSATSSLPGGYMTGVGVMESRMIILLDADRVLSSSDLFEPEAMHRMIEEVRVMNGGSGEAGSAPSQAR